MGAVNYMTSDIITLAIKPYDFDDIRAGIISDIDAGCYDDMTAADVDDAFVYDEIIRAGF